MHSKMDEVPPTQRRAHEMSKNYQKWSNPCRPLTVIVARLTVNCAVLRNTPQSNASTYQHINRNDDSTSEFRDTSPQSQHISARRINTISSHQHNYQHINTSAHLHIIHQQLVLQHINTMPSTSTQCHQHISTSSQSSIDYRINTSMQVTSTPTYQHITRQHNVINAVINTSIHQHITPQHINTSHINTSHINISHISTSR